MIARTALKPQAQDVLRLLLTRGSLSAREAMMMEPPCYRLAARVKELREVYGDDVIATESEGHAGGSHARYVWRGRMTSQRELFV